MWADVIPLHEVQVMESGNGYKGAVPAVREAAFQARAGNGDRPAGYASSGAPLRAGQTQGAPLDGPIQIGGRISEHMVQVAYNAQHKVPWHWQVPAYLVTKGIGAGIFMFLSLGSLTGLFALPGAVNVIMGFLSLLFIGLTTGLLVHDLERPRRFLSILFRPQWRSWLTRGAFLLIGFTLVAGLWWLIEAAALLGLLPAGAVPPVRTAGMWLGLPLAAGVAVYTAFLFGQAEGRDLWQSSLLPFHLLVQAFMVGGGVFLIVDLFVAIPVEMMRAARIVFIAALILDLLITLLGEFGMPHASEIAARAAHDISHGRYRSLFWGGSILVGHLIPLALLLTSAPVAAGAAALAAAIGLFAYEYAFVMAPQDVPNS
jgi:formate-dependent nitrite reductase membrane component NrfD